MPIRFFIVDTKKWSYYILCGQCTTGVPPSIIFNRADWCRQCCSIKTHTPQQENRSTTAAVGPLQDHNNTAVHPFEDYSATIPPLQGHTPKHNKMRSERYASRFLPQNRFDILSTLHSLFFHKHFQISLSAN